MTIDRFEDLECWQEARILVREVYRHSTSAPFNNYRDLKWQLQRAALSIMNNIAEGFNRYSRKERMLFLNYSTGSCGEVRSMLYVCADLHLLSPLEFQNLMIRTQTTQKLVLGFLRYLRRLKS